jgi:hypothetical protein
MAEDSAYAEQFRRAIEDFWSVRTRLELGMSN